MCWHSTSANSCYPQLAASCGVSWLKNVWKAQSQCETLSQWSSLNIPENGTVEVRLFKRGVLMCRTPSTHSAAVLWGPGDKRRRGLWTCDRRGRTAIPFQVCFRPPAVSSKQIPTWHIKARHQHFVLLRFHIISCLFMCKGWIWQY